MYLPLPGFFQRPLTRSPFALLVLAVAALMVTSDLLWWGREWIVLAIVSEKLSPKNKKLLFSVIISYSCASKCSVWQLPFYSLYLVVVVAITRKWLLMRFRPYLPLHTITPLACHTWIAKGHSKNIRTISS